MKNTMLAARIIIWYFIVGVSGVESCIAAESARPAVVEGIVLGVRNTNGSISQKPPFCGPYAHVKNVPKYGYLCVQNVGSWTRCSMTSKPEPTCIAPQNSAHYR